MITVNNNCIMNEEKINLVLMDICGRLPHGVITKNCKNNFDVSAHMLPHVNGIKLLIAEYDLKPYLRPMSSITEEEKEEIKPLFSEFIDEFGKRVLVVRQNKMFLYQDWLNVHHFDYRGLIPMGLALPAPEEMYNIK